MDPHILEQWKKDEAAVFKGWDFSYIKDRYYETKPPWDYVSLAKELVKKSQAVLDIGTGGGEKFAAMAPLPKHAVASEGYLPNVEVAAKNLEPLGVRVLHAEGKDPLPFADNEFDLVINRHSAVNAREIFRILCDNGNFFTQQVGANHVEDLMNCFNAKAKWPEHTEENIRKQLEEVGFTILRCETWNGVMTFHDVGAIVYYLKAIPWVVQGFSVATHLPYLEKLQNMKKEKYEFTTSYFLIHARKN